MSMKLASPLRRTGLSIGCIVFGLLLSACAESEVLGKIEIGKKVSIWSEVLGEKRTLHIYTPPGYADGWESYPVLYLLDGKGNFHHTTGIVDFMARNELIPKMIVVGVVNTDRTRDLTPSSGDMGGKQTGGGGDNFLKFLSDELIPWVDTEYGTRPYRVLVGHSFGGLFSMHALTTRPDLFQGIIAISPSMYWDDNYPVRAVTDWLNTKPQTDNTVYITMGNEGGETLGGAKKVAEMLASRAPQGMRSKFVHMPLESHGSVPHRSTYDGLEFLFHGWSLQNPLAVYEAGGWEAIEDHYRTIRSQFGYEPHVPKSVRYAVGAAFFAATPARLNDALDFINNPDIESYDLQPMTFHYIAGEFAKRGDAEGMKRSYQLCLERFPSNEIARMKLKDLGVELPPSPQPEQ